MKKILLIFILLISLCGCKQTGAEYIISSMGFDNSDGLLNICFEAIVINSETTESQIKLLEGKGKTVKDGIKQIKKSATQKLLLSHCGVLVMGENLTQSQIDGIYEFCFDERDITLSARVVTTKNAKQLLQSKSVSSIAVGYDILGLIEQYSKKDKQIKNRYFEIMALEKQVVLPKITPTKEGYYLENY